MPRKRKERQTSQDMCPTKEDRPAPWSQGQEAALKKEKDKITFTEHLSIQSTSCCTGWHMPSHFPGHTLDRWSSAHPEISSTLLPFPLYSQPLAHLLSLHFSPCPLPTTRFSERLWAALAGCQLFTVWLRPGVQSRTNKGSFPWYHCFCDMYFSTMISNEFDSGCIAERHRTPVPALPLGALRKVIYSLGLGFCIHERWPHFGPGLHKVMDAEHWAPGLAHVPIRSLCFVTPLSLPWHLLNPH